jgi:hypothetical protein
VPFEKVAVAVSVIPEPSIIEDLDELRVSEGQTTFVCLVEVEVGDVAVSDALAETEGAYVK